MQNKIQINTVLLIIIIILLGIGIWMISNKKQNMPPVTQNNISAIPNSSLPTEPCNVVSTGSLENQFNSLRCKYSLKYSTFSDALNAFRMGTDPNMNVTQVSFYVAGKLPREDGNPYFIGRGTINASTNDCVVGYMNLVTGVVESHHDVCIIYN